MNPGGLYSLHLPCGNLRQPLVHNRIREALIAINAYPGISSTEHVSKHMAVA